MSGWVQYLPDVSTLALVAIFISASLCVAIVASWAVFSSSSVLFRTVLVANLFIMLVALQIYELFVFATSEFVVLLLAILYWPKARRYLSNADNTNLPKQTAGFSLQTMFGVMTFAAIMVAASQFLANQPIEIARIIILTGVISAIVCGIGIYLAVGSWKLRWRVLASVCLVLLGSFLLAQWNGFLDDSTVLVDPPRWDVSTSDVTLARWIMTLGLLCLTACVTSCMWKWYRESARRYGWSLGRFSTVLVWIIWVTGPCVFVITTLLTQSDQGLVFYEFEPLVRTDELSRDFAAELRSGVFDISVDSRADDAWLSQSGNKFDYPSFDQLLAVRPINNSNQWVGTAKKRFRCLQLLALSRHDLRWSNRAFDLARDFTTASDKNPSYLSIRRAELDESDDKAGWRGQVYKDLLWITGTKYRHELVEFERHAETWRRMLAIDFAVRSRMNPKTDTRELLREELKRWNDPYAKSSPFLFRYILHGEEFTIYSVGHDGIDDHAKPSKSLYGKGDIVLPRENEASRLVSDASKTKSRP